MQFICRRNMLRNILAIAFVLALFTFVATPIFAQDPEPPPPPPSDPITQIFQYVLQFPTDSLVEALTQALQAILTKSIEPLEQVFSASLARWVTTSPGILTPGGGIVDGVDVMAPTWNLTSRIAILLWPLTLAITAVIAAKDVITAGKWGIGDLKQALGTWLVAVIGSASSLYWMDLANRFANATTDAILNLSFFGAGGFDPNLLTSVLLGSAVLVLSLTGLGLIVAIIIIVIGVSILASLIFQFLARYALLYVLVALAPIVIMLSVLPPMRWFTFMWLRGFVMVLVIGPINALLMKLVILLGARGLSNDPISAFVNFMAAAGVLSALLAINYTLIRFVFGAFGQVLERAVGTVTAVGTLALAAATGGIAAAGAVSAAGGTSSSRSAGIGLQTAGSMMGRSGGVGRGLGGALWGIGSALRENNHGFTNANNSQPAPNGNLSSPTNSSQASNNGASPTANNSAPISQQSATTQLPNTNSQDTRQKHPAREIETDDSSEDSEATTQEPQEETQAPNSNALNRAQTNPTRGEFANSTPITPTRSPRILPTETNARQPNNTTNTRTLSQVQVAPQAHSLIKLLDAPLGERVQALTESYASPSEQMGTAQGAVAALSALEAHHNIEPQMLAASWDQTMGPIASAAREGMSLSTMANDAGYRGDVTQFIGARVESGLLAARPSSKEPLFPRVEAPANVPWHPQISPHDVEVGQQLTTLLGAPSHDAMNFAHIYHSIRSPENGSGWNAGMGLRDAAQQVTQIEPAKRLGALDSRLHAMEQQGTVSQNGMRLWRVYLSRKQNQKG